MEGKSLVLNPSTSWQAHWTCPLQAERLESGGIPQRVQVKVRWVQKPWREPGETRQIYEWQGHASNNKPSSPSMLFLANANQGKFGDWLCDLCNDAASKHIWNLETLFDAYTTLVEYVKETSNNNPSETVNAYPIVEGMDNLDAGCCKTSMNDYDLIDDSWMLLDTASTINIFKNSIYLCNVWNTRQSTTVHTSAGNITINKGLFAILALLGYIPPNVARKHPLFPRCRTNTSCYL